MTIVSKHQPPQHDPAVPPLQHGDRMTADEFERRWANTPDLKKAELLDGMVYLAADETRRLDPRIPPLENGDRLTRNEFERRWNNMPHLKKAELLNGEVFMPPPVSAVNHGMPHSDLVYWLGAYRVGTPGVVVADNSTLRLPPDDDAQPDAMLLVESAAGGKARFDGPGYVWGIPEWVAEVAATSAAYDLHTKREVYRRAGIPEYVAWRTLDRAIDWFVLRADGYEAMDPGPDGIYRSVVYPGLWLHADALIRGDMAEVTRVVQRGLACPEHAAFVTRLQEARRQPPRG